MNYGENIIVIWCFYNAAFLEKVLKAKVDNRKKKKVWNAFVFYVYKNMLGKYLESKKYVNN